MKTTIFFLALLVCLTPIVHSQTAEDMDRFAERLRALEEHLGLAPSEVPTDWDSMMQRLEALEQEIFGETDTTDEPVEVIADQPAETADIEFKEWDGTEADLEAMSSMGGFGMGMSGYETGNAIRNFEQEGFAFSGYGVASYQYSEQQDISTFDANAFELGITGSLNEWAIWAADLDFINEGMDPINPLFRHPSFGEDNRTGIYDTGGSSDDDDDFILEQLYMAARPYDFLTLQAGKFNVPTGIEPRDPSTRFAVNPTLIWSLWPQDSTGLRATFQVTDQWSVSPYMFNGWDNDENINDSFIYAVYQSYQVNEDVQVGGTLAYGAPFPANNSDDALLIDLETRYTGIDNVWLAFEVLYMLAETDNLGIPLKNNEAEFLGAAVVGNYRFHPNFGITAQSSVVEDIDGVLYGSEQTRWEASIIPTVYFNENLELRFQYQHISSSDRIAFRQPVNLANVWSTSENILLFSVLWTY